MTKKPFTPSRQCPHPWCRTATAEMRAGLEQCAATLLENYWVQLHVPNRLRLKCGRMHLRVLYGLNWLS